MKRILIELGWSAAIGVPLLLLLVVAHPRIAEGQAAVKGQKLPPADATHAGYVTTGTQTFAGDKSFSGTIFPARLTLPSLPTQGPAGEDVRIFSAGTWDPILSHYPIEITNAAGGIGTWGGSITAHDGVDGTKWAALIASTGSLYATGSLDAARVNVGATGLYIGTSGTKITQSGRCTATLGTGPIASNTTSTQDITCTGAAVGAECVVGGPATLEAGLLQTCLVSSAGTIRLRTGNNTAGAITPAGSQTVSVRYFNP